MVGRCFGIILSETLWIINHILGWYSGWYFRDSHIETILFNEKVLLAFGNRDGSGLRYQPVDKELALAGWLIFCSGIILKNDAGYWTSLNAATPSNNSALICFNRMFMGTRPTRSWDVMGIYFRASGKLAWLWKITIFNRKTHYTWPCSIDMSNYQRVYSHMEAKNLLWDSQYPIDDQKPWSDRRPRYVWSWE